MNAEPTIMWLGVTVSRLEAECNAKDTAIAELRVKLAQAEEKNAEAEKKPSGPRKPKGAVQK